jgi:hypothetical protein
LLGVDQAQGLFGALMLQSDSWLHGNVPSFGRFLDQGESGKLLARCLNFSKFTFKIQHIVHRTKVRLQEENESPRRGGVER